MVCNSSATRHRLSVNIFKTAQLHDAFGNHVHVGFHGFVHLVEEFVQADKTGHFTFQCACFICICRSTADARRWFIRVFNSDRRWREMSFSVSYIVGDSMRLAVDVVMVLFVKDLLPSGFV